MPSTFGKRQCSNGLTLWVATVQKGGHQASENEDIVDWSLDNGRFAISDGATDAAFSGIWATELARRFVGTGTGSMAVLPEGGIHDWLVPLQQSWHASVPWESLAWYMEEKARQGAFATLLGLEIDRLPEPSKACSEAGSRRVVEVEWRAIAVGDSCLFHWRNRELLTAYPLKASTEFGTRPYLIGSNPESNRDLIDHRRHVSGTCAPGDHFVLTSDALAHWLLREKEAGRWPFADLVASDDGLAFVSLIMRLRERHEIHNDDTTMMHVMRPPLPMPDGGGTETPSHVAAREEMADPEMG